MNGERVIDIFDFLYVLLTKWRVFIAAAIVFVIIFSGIKIAGNYSVVQREKAETTDSIILSEYEEAKAVSEAAEKTLKVPELHAARIAADNYRIIRAKEVYLEESIYMNLDPYKVVNMEIRYTVDTGYVFDYTKENTSDKNEIITDSYVQLINDYMDYDALGLDIKTQYIKELVYAGKTQTNNFYISVYGRNEDEVKQIAGYVDSYIRNEASHSLQNISEHNLIVLSENYGVSQFPNIANAQTNARTDYTKNCTELANVTKGFTPGQNAVYKFLTMENDQKKNIGVKAVAKKKLKDGVIKFAIIGLVLGMAVVAVFYSVVYIYGNTINTTEELKELAGGFVFGEISYVDKSDKKKKCVIDSLINRLRNRSKLSYEDLSEIAIENMKLVLCNKEITKVALVSTEVLSEKAGEFAAKAIEELKKSGIEAVLVENSLSKADKLAQMSETKQVIVLGQLHKSVYSEIYRISEMAQVQGFTVVGGVAI